MCILIENLSYRFKDGKTAALEGVNATIPKGKIIALAGADGAGKTTLIRLIAGLLKPTEGKITLCGYESDKKGGEMPSLIGYMPQKFGLYEDLTVMQNLLLHADLKNLGGRERELAFERLLEFTSLSPFTKRLAGNLSGGMKQKLGLACALLKKPEVLLLDEPTVGVDPISRKELWKMVEQLLSEGITILWSTAYLNEVERCDGVILLNNGKILYQGAPRDLTKKMEGRVFKISGIEGNRRKFLFQILNEPSVMDGTIQGRELRIVMKEKGIPHFSCGVVHEEAPRFEDGYIDILGGGPGGYSPLAELREGVAEKNDTPVVATDLTKVFGKFTAAQSITFSVKRGEIFALLGPNGAGKSTTFKMLCGLLQPTFGKALVNGFDLVKVPGKARGEIGYMAQKFSLYSALSVQQNLSFFAGIYDLKGERKRKAIEEMIEIFSLQNYLSVTADSLPLGYKQRLALACANMHMPSVIFLDEPTSGTDPITRREFWNHINGLAEKGVTVMVTTHFMDEAEYCDRIALVYGGKIIHLDTPDHLKAIAKSEENQNPTLEDAFIKLIEEYDKAPLR